MRPGFSVPLRNRLAWLAATLALLTLVAAANRRAPAPAHAAAACCAMGSKGAMSDADMQAMAAAHYKAAPAHGFVATTTTAVAADTFLVSNYQFNADHNSATQVDVVHITAGQSIMFKWVVGIHTSTSGLSSDVTPGLLWDFPVDTGHHETIVAFPTPGTYPFFCQYHGDLFNMVGTVVVAPGVTPTKQASWGKVKANYR
jgi:plastocyanin